MLDLVNWKVITNPFQRPEHRKHAVVGYHGCVRVFALVNEVTGVRTFKSPKGAFRLKGLPDDSATQVQDMASPLGDAWFCTELRKEMASLKAIGEEHDELVAVAS